jgi:DNA-binding NtrC family response regulator
VSDGTLECVSQGTRTSAERVLIVEDEESTRSGLTELVRSWGYTAEEACDGADALERITEFRPTIIVSDLVMPRMNGIELLKAIGDDTDHMKVILLTAQGTVDTAVEAVKAGAEDYLSKPVDPQRLRRLLDRLTELNAQKRENQALRRQLTDRGRFGRIIGHSPSMRAIYCANPGLDPDPGRIRDRKGARRPDHPPAEPARRRAVRRPELCRDSRDAAGERDFRA